jgi:hypothetical protein
MAILKQWLLDTLTLFNADKTGNPLQLIALLGRLFLIAVVVLVPIGAVVEIHHRLRRRRERSEQLKPTRTPD